MGSGDSPAVARRRVRIALREAREAKNLTQGQVADAMEWSLSKVMRIESGEVTISLNDLRPLLGYLGIKDRVRVDELVQSARAARRRQMWWDEQRFREHLTPSLRQLIQYETQATAVRHFDTATIPGRLQTPAYAELILRTYANELSDEDIKIRLEARLRRRSELLARENSPEIFLLLDESVLHREFGSAQVIGEQLRDLVDGAEKRIRVLPFTAGAPPAMWGSYEIYTLDQNDDAIMYRESLIFDEIVEDPVTVKHHLDVFERMWNAALDEATSVRLIEKRAASVLSSGRGSSPGH
jgi:transcriptional regulator with XRE-family HTH domain